MSVTRSNLRQYDLDLGQTGIVSPQIGFESSFTIATGRAYVCRFRPSRNMAITLAAFCLKTAAASNDSIEIAIYNSALTSQLGTTGQVAAKLNSGSTIAPTVNFTSTVNLVAGTVYYANMCCPTTSAGATLLARSINDGSRALLFGSSAGVLEMMHYANGTGVLAGDIHAASFTTENLAPIIALRES